MSEERINELQMALETLPGPRKSPFSMAITCSSSARTAPFSLVTNEMASAVRESLIGKRFTLFLKMCLKKITEIESG